MPPKIIKEKNQAKRQKMAEISEASEDLNGSSNIKPLPYRHSRTNSSTSSTSTEDGLVLSVASLNKSGSNSGKRPNSGNNNSASKQCSSAQQNTEVTCLRAELESCKNQLKTKDEEINKLSKIRDELENEVQELTGEDN